MTTTHTTVAESVTADGVDVPQLQGISHLGLTVTDVDRAAGFWCTVMGFRIVMQSEEYCMVWHPSSLLAIGLTAQGDSAVTPFDEHHVGLDHLGLAVADVATLTAWADRFAALAVPHSPITETDAGHHLNLRAPDDFPIELFVIKAEFAAGFLGVEVGVGAAAAGTHR